MNREFLITVCASGGGGNFEAVVKEQDRIGYRVVRLLIDRECGAAEKAVRYRIPVTRLDRSLPATDFFAAMDQAIPSSTDLVVLAGFFPIISGDMCRKWAGKMINTHPSLLPKYGGKGMYGVRVQEAVLANEEKFAGCTVHFVDETIDGGKIILQKELEVLQGETAWDLGGRVFLEENRILVAAIQLLMRQREDANVQLE
jgi:phosphoribosylglycinamide formyltransferase-1